MTIRSTSLRGTFIAAICTAALAPCSLHADWTTFSLSPFTQTFASYQVANLPDGRFVYGSTNSLSLQTTFGSAPFTSYSGVPSWDPSAVAVESNTLGVVGTGMFGATNIYTFNPSSTSTAFTAIPGVTIQNYTMTFRDAASLYVGGGNGSASNGFGQDNSVSYVKLDGSANKVIIDNVSSFSAGIALDAAGNLYVADDDDLKLYKFTPAQLTLAITGSPLAITDGTFVTTLRADGSIAVDSMGRVWSAGFQINGIDMYDPSNNSSENFLPGLDNDDYVVSTFSNGTDGYVAYLNASGSNAGSSVTYGYQKTVTVVPEPASAALLTGGVAFVASLRRRKASRAV